MCGLAGFLDARATESASALRDTATAMAKTLDYRGPDADGCWTDEAAGIALAHRRLSIIDLSPTGAQPMVSASGRSVIAYNGEVYNFGEIRDALIAEGYGPFRGTSDTEIVLEACEAWGVKRAVERFIGMFAFALWDREARRLTLVRDRIGIKPLYWAQFGPLFLFGSELKALRAHDGWPVAIDRNAIAAFMRHNYVPTPHTVYQDVRKLPPGSLLELAPDGTPRITAYWSLDDVVTAGQSDPLIEDDKAAADALEALLADAVGRRMIADVPLGAFLSGGLDSSTVVALMQANSTRPVKTFSIGFAEAGYNEAQHAKQVARHLGTDHTELYVEPDHALSVIERMPEMYDEPFADSSQIPTFLISELTRPHVTVALSGDGGDELFAGYNRYFQNDGPVGRLTRAPRPARNGLATALSCLSPAAWDTVFGVVPERWRPPQAGDKVHKLADVLRGEGDALYRRYVSHWDNPNCVVPGGSEPLGPLWDPEIAARVPEAVARMQYLDTITYLPDDILTKVDRASMAVSLEARVPLLDHRVAEFAWRLPRRQKIRNGKGKWLLRQVLYRYVPRKLVERPKMGFGVPLDDWLRGPLRDWAGDLLSEASLNEIGVLAPQPVRQKWQEHQEGRRNWQYLIWDALMFQAWARRWL
jgi:asparagine synthase (glutamine-hydrolysing)